MTDKSQLERKPSRSISDARIAGLYDLQKTIGKGHFAVVKLASHVFTGEKVAVKVIDKTKFDSSMASHLIKEVRCMKLVQHPNIVRLYEVIDTQTKLFLILELGDYDMYDFITKNADKGCPESEAQQYFCQIIKAIDYCHQLHVVHRDLKPENVVFFERLGMVKLTDFGFSNKFIPGEQLETACGSLAYSAPEILLGDAYDAPAVDVWSLGVILYMLLCGRLPFQEANDSETLTKILDCKYSLPDTLSLHARYLISRMLVKDVQKRAALSEIINSSWVKAGDLGLAQILPLVGRDVLPESAHTTIIDQMVAGGVDTEENILRSLDNDDFSYITATYYLLAERVLASYREERARKAHEIERPSLSDLPADFKNCPEIRETVEKSDEGSIYKSRSRSNSWRGSTSVSRWPCTILKEESEEELSTYHCGTSRQSSRHSSCSVSIFPSNSGSHGRISPQDIQGLLELSRLNIAEGKRRTLSPDSRLSSRSSSPPNSSGRASPAVSRLKVSFTGSGGLRKLGSSPHLLGICEETEEYEFDKGAEQRQTVTRRSISGASIVPLSASRLFIQPKLAKEDSLGATLTYSSVRMIRRRQAIVSPDMVQRYEQRSSSRYHAVKPQRSTSSSSETSDDDSERRLNFLASKYCCNYGNRRDNDDDPSKGNGGASIGPSKSGNELVSGNAINTSDNTSCSNDCHYSEQSSQYRSSLGLKLLDITQMAPTILHPIKEMQAVLFPHSLFPRFCLEFLLKKKKKIFKF
ncbi:Protein kinase domain containing protein [Brugia malayi]|uniref:SNF-related serine/threonine-protein kinase n=2 Tax=Brugia malayi TaxID=6279 RepID=A0A1P6CCP4_BRUMA|nr:Protein kinase domain containing protein [Brugia malayi]CDQ01925.1 Bm7490, isoform m [Brugia malayi]VIO96036.1 Protein kinase domain containing protein [Brugia malayi]